MARHTLIAAMVIAAAAPIALGQTDGTAKPASVPAQKIATPAGQPAAKAPKAEPTLKVGDKAPQITIEKWVKGEPITGYEKGRVYVVEFWATWCGPCIASMPHLTHLQKEYKDKVQIIGVTTKDPNNSLEQVEKMVSEKGNEGMGYAVAWDEGTKTKEALFKAAGQTGIPCSFVIDGTGTVAYIGHPMWLDIPLERITEGDVGPGEGRGRDRDGEGAVLRGLEGDVGGPQGSGEPAGGAREGLSRGGGACWRVRSTGSTSRRAIRGRRRWARKCTRAP
jgi:thiol-disulfide isomerase/thioredoxin